MQTVLQLEDFRAVKDERLRGLLTPMMDHFIEGLREDEGTNGILAYDALAAYVLLNRGAFGFAPMNIQIETKGEHTAGMSVAERRPYKQMTPNTQVAVNVDQTRFRQGFFGTLSA
jgi:inosine-uridine nucleoside N-ribohydrolase